VCSFVDHYSVVHIAIRCRLDSPGIESPAAERSEARVWVDRLLEMRVRIPPASWTFVLCVGNKDKMQNNEDKRTSTDEVGREYRRKKSRSIPSLPALGLTQTSIKWKQGSFSWGKAAGE
jgi:hypothetical protein